MIEYGIDSLFVYAAVIGTIVALLFIFMKRKKHSK